MFGKHDREKPACIFCGNIIRVQSEEKDTDPSAFPSCVKLGIDVDGRHSGFSHKKCHKIRLAFQKAATDKAHNEARTRSQREAASKTPRKPCNKRRSSEVANVLPDPSTNQSQAGTLCKFIGFHCLQLIIKLCLANLCDRFYVQASGET